MTQLSEHFSLAELTVSANAVRLGLDNTPPPTIQRRLAIVAGELERIRALLGDRPIRVSSAYRSAAVNRAAKGAKSSAHLDGWAVDFQCPSYGPPLAIALQIAASAIVYDQLIHECPDPANRWVHISFDPRQRLEQLTIDGRGTRAGLWVARP